MNFNLRKTSIYDSVKRKRYFLLKYSELLTNLFLALLIVSLLLILFSIAGPIKASAAIKTPVLFLALSLTFWEISLFQKLKIKKPGNTGNLAEIAENPDDYNLADFLSLPAAEIVEYAMKFAKRKGIHKINSAVLFYAGLKLGNDIKLIIFRLGLDIKKIEIDVKNYIEKTRVQALESGISPEFESVIADALSLSAERKNNCIGEKEILVAIAKNDEFFKKMMVESDLKETDIENITLWLDSIEKMHESLGEKWSYDNLIRAGSVGKDWASGYTITLDAFSIDWRERFKKGYFFEVVGHEKEIQDLEMVLGRSSQTNALIVGDPGAGRKSIVEALAQKAYLRKTIPELDDKRVVELDMVSLASRIESMEKLESILDQIFQEVLAAGNVVLVIDNLHNFVGGKEARLGATDITGILSKYMPLQNFQFVATTDYEGLHNKIERSPSFASLFRKIEVQEISEIETIRVLQSLALGLEQKDKILITYPAIREIVNLTGRYFPSMPFPKKAIDVLEESAVYLRTLNEKILLPHHIAKIISDKTEIPVGKMEFKEKEVLLNLENLIHQRIVNQEEAVKEISIAMRRARAGIASKKRPMGTFLFLGPTGVGKTETSKALAHIYFGSEEKMIRIDMSEFQTLADIPRLIGQVSPVEMQGLLTTPVRETPFSLVLLDEIEKAHPNILNLFLQVLDEGHITDGQGRKVMFTNTIIICTSNAGAEQIFKSVESGSKIEKDRLLSSLFEKGAFRPEFVNRFDATVIFNPLTKEHLLEIAEMMLSNLKKNLKEKEIDFEITEPLKEKIVQLSYKPEFGAREMRRVVQDKVENAVAEALIAERIKKGDSFEIDPETFELAINAEAGV